MESKAEMCDDFGLSVGWAADFRRTPKPTSKLAGNAMKREIALGAALAFLGSASLLPKAGLADEQSCVAAANQHLARLGVEQAEAKEILVVEQVQFVDGEPKTIGYQAWVDLQSCSQGKLAIKMSLLCRYKTAFTTPGCDVPGSSN
jgi:hypothetical protein